MPRGRAKLPEKLERIMVQATLMGLTTSDMVKIGNRMRALDEERQDLAEIAEKCQGFSWTAIKTGWRINDPNGYVVDCVKEKKKKNSGWYGYDITWTVTADKPGTRFKPVTLKSINAHVNYNWRKGRMPEGSKELYGLIRWLRDRDWSKVR